LDVSTEIRASQIYKLHSLQSDRLTSDRVSSEDLFIYLFVYLKYNGKGHKPVICL